MEQRGLIIGAVLILALYAGLSCWPAVRALLEPAPAAPVLASAPIIAPLPSVPAAPPAAPRPGNLLPGPRPAPAEVLSQALAEAQTVSAADADKAPVEVRWQVLTHSVELSEWPGGPGVQPPAASHATLTICRGSSLQVIEQKGNWAQVRSRGQNTGWVCVDDLALTN